MQGVAGCNTHWLVNCHQYLRRWSYIFCKKKTWENPRQHKGGLEPTVHCVEIDKEVINCLNYIITRSIKSPKILCESGKPVRTELHTTCPSKATYFKPSGSVSLFCRVNFIAFKYFRETHNFQNVGHNPVTGFENMRVLQQYTRHIVFLGHRKGS